MPAPSRAELARLFDDDELAEHVRFLEIAASWPSLRILDYLYREGASSTGDLARGLNMDMRDARDRLEELSAVGMVDEAEGTWTATVDRVDITVRRNGGLELSSTLGGDADAEDGAPEAGFFERLGRRLDGLVGRAKR